MLRKVNVVGFAALVYILAITFVSVGQAHQESNGGGKGGWTLPPNAADEKNPLTPDPATLAAGKDVFHKKCERCHGPGGLGDGKDADPDVQQDMDLTVAGRALAAADLAGGHLRADAAQEVTPPIPRISPIRLFPPRATA
jgi:mono/diheme cytochrome c family protein